MKYNERLKRGIYHEGSGSGCYYRTANSNWWEFTKQINKRSDAIDIIELRIDQLENISVDDVSKLVIKLKTLPKINKVLVTYRTTKQGGSGEITSESYMNLLSSLANVKEIDMVDIEWEKEIEIERFQQVIKSCKVRIKKW